MIKCSCEFPVHTPQQLERAAELFKSMSDPTRLEILCLLLHGEQSVGQLSGGLICTQSGVSHQLRLLKSLRLVKCRREGKRIYYSLDDSHIEDMLKVAFAHSSEAGE
jgi:ArsR family transcriptional regulator